MDRRRAGALVLVATSFAFAGCALISGAADLQVEPALGDKGDAGGVDDAPSTPSTPRPDASDGASPPLDASKDVTSGDASDGGRIREVTFENGTLVGVNGGDVVSGMLQVESLTPVDGLHSMLVDTNSAFLQTNIAPVSELFATFLVRVDNLAVGNLSMAQFLQEGGGAFVELIPSTNTDKLEVTVGGTSIGIGGTLTDNGATYRLGFHIRQGTGTGLVQVFVSTRGGAFGAPIIENTSLTLGRIAAVKIGSMRDGDMTLHFDDLLLDTASMPPP